MNRVRRRLESYTAYKRNLAKEGELREQYLKGRYIVIAKKPILKKSDLKVLKNKETKDA